MKKIWLFFILSYAVCNQSMAQTGAAGQKRKNRKPSSSTTVDAAADTTTQQPAIEKTSPIEPQKNGVRQNTALQDSYNVAGPSWMFTLGLNPIMDIPFETSLTDFSLYFFQDKGTNSTLSANSSYKSGSVKYKAQIGTVKVDHFIKTASKRLVLGLGLGTTRTMTNISGTVNYVTEAVKSITIKGKEDAPRVNGTVSFLLKPGLWIGLGSTWGKTFQSDETEFSIANISIPPSKKTNNYESTRQQAAIEYITPAGQGGLEYYVSTSPGKTLNGWNVPLRIGISEQTFIGAAISGETGQDIDDSQSEMTSGVTLEFGQQFSSSGYQLAYAYNVTKGFSSGGYFLEKEKIISTSFMSGHPKGLRYGFNAGYLTSEDTKEVFTKGPFMGLDICYVN